MDKDTFLKKAKIVKRYTLWSGNRFACVQVGTWKTDVLIRMGKNGEEISTAEAKEKAWEFYKERGGLHVSDV